MAEDDFPYYIDAHGGEVCQEGFGELDECDIIQALRRQHDELERLRERINRMEASPENASPEFTRRIFNEHLRRGEELDALRDLNETLIARLHREIDTEGARVFLLENGLLREIEDSPAPTSVPENRGQTGTEEPQLPR